MRKWCHNFVLDTTEKKNQSIALAEKIHRFLPRYKLRALHLSVYFFVEFILPN